MATIYEDDNRDLRCRNCDALLEGDALGELPERCPCCGEWLDWWKFAGLDKEV